MSSLMAVASASLIIPATLYAVMETPKNKTMAENQEKNIAILSHGTAIILLILYVLYLYFQLVSHADFFEDPAIPHSAEPEEALLLSPWAAGVALVLVTICVAVCADYLVDSIDSVVETAHISKTFIGLILLPIIGNAAEHVTAVVVSTKNKMNLAIGVAIGSSLQIALLVTPLLVVLGWIIDQPMTLHFETFETVIFFLSMLVVNCKTRLECGGEQRVNAFRPHSGWPLELPRRVHANRNVRRRLLPSIPKLSHKRRFFFIHAQDANVPFLQIYHNWARLFRIPRQKGHLVPTTQRHLAATLLDRPQDSVVP